MQIQVDIEFDELLKAVKTLPSAKLKMLKNAIENNSKNKSSNELKRLLLKGPVATKKQLETIAKNRKAINQWRMN